MTASFILRDEILTQAQKALANEGESDCTFIKNIKFTPSGAVCLYEKGLFPWGGLPYPHEHARLGKYLVQLEYLDLAQKMALFQFAMLDHHHQPIAALFCQEGKVSYHQLKHATEEFLSLIETPHLHLPIIDEELGFFRMGDSQTTSLITASGCGTGLGAFYHGDAAILSFAPQISVIGDCRAFGIAGKPQELSYQHENGVIQCHYRNRLACPYSRQTGIDFLSDCGYSGLWVKVSHRMDEHSLQTSAQVIGPQLTQPLCWTFFAKARLCVVAGSHCLSPNSLDRYQGPIQKIEMRGQEGSVLIQSPIQGEMEVIPLAGDDSFWGADFLVVFKTSTYSMECVLSDGKN